MLTVKQIQAAKQGEWLSDGGVRGAGALLFRRTAGGILAYFRYTLANGKRDVYPIGTYDENGRNGLTLAKARERAGELSRLYQSGVKNIRGHLEAEAQVEREANETRKREREQAASAAKARERYTLRALCEAYVKHLEDQGKIKSASDAKSAFNVHLFKANPELASVPAAEVQPEQIADRLRAIRKSGKDRTAGILRSYLNSAFNTAIGAKFDTGVSADFNGFDLKANPIILIKAIPVRAGERYLSEGELKTYLKNLGDGIIDRALRLALLAGGQRMAQLLRVRAGDWTQRERVLRLWDGKGKRAEPREHLLPLGPKGAALVEALIQRAHEEAGKRRNDEPIDPNPRLFLSSGGACVVGTTPGKRVAEIAADMKSEPFDLRDIRRTVETRLAGLGISRDLRAQILSHGLSGVQNQHYDRHDYMDEKRRALIAWERYLDGLENGQKGSAAVRIKRTAS